MAIKALFKSHQPFMTYVFKDGMNAHFIGGRFLTDIESQVKELAHEVECGHPMIYVDPNEPTVDTSFQEGLEEAKAKAVEAYLKANQEATKKDNDMGSTGVTAQLKGIATSQTIAQAAADSSSGAQLMPAPAAPQGK